MGSSVFEQPADEASEDAFELGVASGGERTDRLVAVVLKELAGALMGFVFLDQGQDLGILGVDYGIGF
ncbi:MAG: hypothetical protein ACOX52_09915 [Verrucomicrobiota bacterium]